MMTVVDGHGLQGREDRDPVHISAETLIQKFKSEFLQREKELTEKYLKIEQELQDIWDEIDALKGGKTK